jgi:hypothetical protein
MGAARVTSAASGVHGADWDLVDPGPFDGEERERRRIGVQGRARSGVGTHRVPALGPGRVAYQGPGEWVADRLNAVLVAHFAFEA